MNTLTARIAKKARAQSARVTARTLRVALDDGREISVPFSKAPWLKWLAKSTLKQRANWSLEPGGYAIFWPDLDDGVEVRHLLDCRPIA
jgi:hypothetical protein